MTTPAWSKAWEKYSHLNPTDCLRRSHLKIISMHPGHNNPITESSEFQELEALGLQWSWLSRPCQLHGTGVGLSASIVEIEAKKSFTQQAWEWAIGEPIGASIGLSHQRALHEAFQVKPSPDIVIILEEDVLPSSNLLTLFGHVMAEWWGNVQMESTHYISLTYDDSNAGLMKKVFSSVREVPGTRGAKHFFLQALPHQDKGKGRGGGYEWVGQGARAYAVSRELGQALINEPISHWWDMHVKAVLDKHRRSQLSHQGKAFYACLAWPLLFKHEIDMAHRLRGSGRLLAQATGPAEQISRYISLDLSGMWGFSNRAQTLCSVAQWCSMHRFGAYVLWNKNDACDSTFDEVCTLVQDHPVMKNIPFIRFFEDGGNSSWKASKNDKEWPCGDVKFQVHCSLCMHWCHQWYTNYLQGQGPRAQGIYQDIVDHHFLDKDPAEMLTLIDISPDIKAQAKMIFDEALTNSGCTEGVAFHVRRGDLRYFRETDTARRTNADYRKQRELREQWEKADRDIKAAVVRVVRSHRHEVAWHVTVVCSITDTGTQQSAVVPWSVH